VSVADIFSDGVVHPVKEKFEYHTLTVILPAGQSETPIVRVECKGSDRDDCVCDSKYCQLEELIDNVGPWDVMRSAGEIELARLSARADWSDPEEPWIDVEP
jgi:hypothetical protein